MLNSEVEYRVRRNIGVQFEGLMSSLKRPVLLTRMKYHIEDCFLGIARNDYEYFEQMFEEDLGVFIWLSDCICEKRVE